MLVHYKIDFPGISLLVPHFGIPVPLLCTVPYTNLIPHIVFNQINFKIMAKKAEKNTGREFKKNYIGKGKQVEGLDIVKVSINIDKAEEFIHEYKGERYLTLEVAKMKVADDYGKTHTAYISAEVKNEK